jgi:hypothetical protein
VHDAVAGSVVHHPYSNLSASSCSAMQIMHVGFSSAL